MLTRKSENFCAFANTSGGTIYVGIDNEGNVKGNLRIQELETQIAK
ncbi:MAG: ATP-binding protein [Clostridia bacterium]|nr:ATP-binding protein [Clostridia bacterium]